MAIEPYIVPPTEPMDLEDGQAPALTVQLDDEVGEEGVIEHDDGSVTIGDTEKPTAEDLPFDGNLAEVMEETDLLHISTDLTEKIDQAIESRSEWWKMYQKGLRLLGLKIEDVQEPWPGAAGMFHPVLTEAVIRFESNAISEIFPPAGPVKSKIIGKATPDRVKQAKRVVTDMNHLMTDQMPAYREEWERLLFHLPLAGSAFKKVYPGPDGECESEFIAADDMIVPYGTSTIQKSEMNCHRLKVSENWIMQRIANGTYRDVPLTGPTDNAEEVEEAEAETVGEEPTFSTRNDGNYTLCEVHALLEVEIDDDGSKLKKPYIITFDKDTGQVFSLYRNWIEGSNNYKPIQFFVHYKYFPGFGFYGLGLIHLIAGLAETATLALRQLVDAGTLSNMPSGFKAADMRNKGDNEPFIPGQFQDIDVTGDDIRANIYALPFKEPSTVLYQLFKDVVDEARNLAATPDLKISEMSAEAPVGTALAIIERSMKVLTAVQSRIHTSFKREVKMIHDIIRDFYPDEYPFETDEGATRAQDYDDRVDIVPVTNPNSATLAQRVMTHQAVLQLAQSAPELYDRKKLHRNMVEAMGYDGVEEILPDDEEILPKDPLTENADALTMAPLKAHMHQDHDAHIAVHMALGEDPNIGETLEKSPQQAQQIHANLMAHVAQHLGFKMRAEVEQRMGVPLPPPDQPLPPEAENELARLVRDAMQQLIDAKKAQQAQQEAQEIVQDPIYQQREKELGIKRAEVQRKAAADRMRHQIERLKVAQDREETGTEASVAIFEAVLDALENDRALTVQEIIEGTKLGTQTAAQLQNRSKQEG